ncbi:hypothetical protein BCON_0201g00050 [Botryotinia convoluta]|uniref:Peptidase M20 dimerisation domain-containing protein n=1 Tax=Botryotinia convoluta TaxID=54673 RepID=A0A4Z1HY89_9HELO|nr:hypothetical protein BCON_0201g00050 [Botryotinia convoluta]
MDKRSIIQQTFLAGGPHGRPRRRVLESIGGYRVIKGIGGHGVVGILENGSGATVLLRADMDALPHLENTNLEYASTKIFKGSDGKETPMHTAVLLADAKMLLDAKSKWSGTLVVLFQPAEELAVGARAMIEDGLYDPSKFAVPKPDIVLGQHTHAFKAGMIALGGGAILTAVDSFDLRIFGKSGHICRADFIITEEVRPEEFAVIGCASIHGGSTANIIPDFVDLKISTRSYNPSIHERLVAAVKRVVYSKCEISGSLAIREPEFTTTMHAPPTVNDFSSGGNTKEIFWRIFWKELDSG